VRYRASGQIFRHPVFKFWAKTLDSNDLKSAKFSLYRIEEIAAMMNTLDKALAPAEIGTTRTTTPFSQVVCVMEVSSGGTSITQERRVWLTLGRCSQMAENVVVQLWRSFLRGCEMAASVNAKFP
jgi:hypothetical protein